MKAQIKNTLIQIAVGAIVIVVGLMALHKFVPTFTLFPGEEEQVKTVVSEDEKEIADVIKKTELEEVPQDNDSLKSEEEESTAPISEILQRTKPNMVYSADKRLKVSNLGFVKPIEIMRDVETVTTTNFYNEFCERNIPGYQRDINLYFTLKDIKLAEAILFFAVKTARMTYYFKPQGKDNLLKVPNNFGNGRYKLEYGYVLKNDVDKRIIPFFSRSCTVTVKD